MRDGGSDPSTMHKPHKGAARRMTSAAATVVAEQYYVWSLPNGPNSGCKAGPQRAKSALARISRALHALAAYSPRSARREAFVRTGSSPRQLGIVVDGEVPHIPLRKTCSRAVGTVLQSL